APRAARLRRGRPAPVRHAHGLCAPSRGRRSARRRLLPGGAGDDQSARPPRARRMRQPRPRRRDRQRRVRRAAGARCHHHHAPADRARGPRRDRAEQALTMFAQTVFDAFMATAEAAPGNVFLCAPPAAGRAYHPAGVEFTYGQTREATLLLRETYAAAGYGHGHRVALLLENRPEFFFHYLALNALGVGIVPINPDYRHDEMLYQMEHSEADLAVVVGSRVADLERVARHRDRPLPGVASEPPPPRLPRPGAARLKGAPGLETETSLLYTSGTTGRPKGCILTNFYYLNAGAWYRDLGGVFRVEYGAERILNPLPLFHMNAQAVAATCAILTANCLAQPDRFSPSRWWQDVVSSQATIIHYVGVMPPLLLKQAPSPEERRHRVKAGFGAGVEPELHPLFEERFGFPLVEVWGMSETGRVFADRHEPRHVTTRAFG